MRNILAVYRRLNHTERRERYKVELTDEQLNKELQAVDERLRKQLGKKKSAQLPDDIMCYIENPDEDEFRFDLPLTQRWILQRVFELGWTLEKFGHFDRYINYQDMRDANKPERIAKKYEWIAEGMNLRWRGIEGYFYDAAGNLIAFDPSVNSAGPGGLLINHRLFLKYLNENGYTLLWHVIGEKLLITGNIPGDDWPGRLDILGVFRLQQHKVDGKLYTRLSE